MYYLDKKFLAFFFKRLRVNSTDRYQQDFPYISPCGRELNYIRCDDLPVVFTHLLNRDGEVIQDIPSHAHLPAREEAPELLSYGGTGNLLTLPFQPEKLCMLPGSGRVYHMGPPIVGGVGLVKSSLALELSQFFGYEAGTNPETAAPVSFSWREKVHKLDDSVLEHLVISQKFNECK